MSDGRTIILREAFPDGAFGCDVVAAPDVFVADDWIELTADDAADCPLCPVLEPTS